MVEIQRHYRHSNDKKEIGWKTSSDRRIIGPTLQKTLDAVRYDRSERSNFFTEEGGWSGDLYVIHRRLFTFQGEISRFMGDSGCGGDKTTQVYEVILNSTSGWAQYLSVVGNELHEETLKQLEKLDFAPKHSYLAKNDPVPFTSGHPTGLWLIDPMEISAKRPGVKKSNNSE
jgi:hypothetical protein